MEQKLIRNPIILALDVDSREEADRYSSQVGDLVGAIKLGPRLIYRYGAQFVQECAKIAPVFVDNKYFDIPSTMVAAVRSSFEAGATLVTVHALAGSEALTQLALLEKELNKVRPFKILAVTILTSWSEKSFPPSFKDLSVADHVSGLAQSVKDSGLAGLVCSAYELSLIKQHNFFTVTPGIRLDSSVRDDQKRVMTPEQALQAGASALVIGRPVLQAQDPRSFIKEILKSI